MLVFPLPRKKRKSRRRIKASDTPPTPPPLTLVAASFDPDGPEVYLTFDRAIDVSALVPAAFAVADGPDNGQFVGFNAPSLVGPNEVQVLMQRVGDDSGDSQMLTVGAGNGIVAADDGGTWEGVTGLGLPFP